MVSFHTRQARLIESVMYAMKKHSGDVVLQDYCSPSEVVDTSLGGIVACNGGDGHDSID